MFTGLSADMKLIYVAIAAMAAFFVGNAMDAVLGSQGFGVVGNMLVLLSGFAVGLNIVHRLPGGLVVGPMVMPAAIAFAFAMLFMLALIKRLVQKV